MKCKFELSSHGRRSVLLDMFLMDEQHTGRNIAREIGKRVHNLTPPEAVLIATTVDGGRDFQLAGKLLHRDLEAISHGDEIDEDSVLDTKTAIVSFANCAAQAFLRFIAPSQLSCSAHLMSGVLKSCFASESAIQTVRTIMVALSGSPTMLNVLHQSQRALKMNVKNPVLDVATRFATSHYMIEDFVDNIYCPLCHATVNGMMEEFDIEVPPPSLYCTLRLIVKATAPLANAIRTLEGETYVTVGLLVPLYLNCMKQLNRVEGEPAELNTFKSKLQTALEEKFGYLVREPNLPLIAMMLHPAFAHCTMIGDELLGQCITELIEWHAAWPLQPPTDAKRRRTMIKVSPAQPTKKDVKNQLIMAIREARNCMTAEQKSDPLFIPPLAQMRPGGEFDPLAFWAQDVRVVVRFVASPCSQTSRGATESQGCVAGGAHRSQRTSYPVRQRACVLNRELAAHQVRRQCRVDVSS